MLLLTAMPDASCAVDEQADELIALVSECHVVPYNT
jgi:hypothetical protein